VLWARKTTPPRLGAPKLQLKPLSFTDRSANELRPAIQVTAGGRTLTAAGILGAQQLITTGGH